MRVFSIDPGIGITGFSIIDTNRRKSSLSAYGTIKPRTKDSLPKRLNYLFEEVIFTSIELRHPLLRWL